MPLNEGKLPLGIKAILTVSILTIGLNLWKVFSQEPRYRFFGGVFWGSYAQIALGVLAVLLLFFVLLLYKQWKLGFFLLLLKAIYLLSNDISSFIVYLANDIPANALLYALFFANGGLLFWYATLLRGYYFQQTEVEQKKDWLFTALYAVTWLASTGLLLAGVY